jgi:hypothetical protein
MFREAPVKVTAKIILEVLGSPREFVEKTLAAVLSEMRTKEFKVIDEKRFKPKEKDKLFNTFAELDIEFENIFDMIGFCFDYMPSSVEITNPLDFNIPAEDLTGTLNDLLGRLHSVELERKASAAQSYLLNQKLGLMLKNMLVLALREKRKTAEELVKDTGIGIDDLKLILDAYCSEGFLLLTEGVYSLQGVAHERTQEPG